MRDRLDHVLEGRRARLRPTRAQRVGIATSVALHAGVAAAVVLGPDLFQEHPRPIEYVAVQVVSAAALGTDRPPPPEPRHTPAPPEPSPPPPEPAMPRPEPRAEEPPPPDPQLPRERDPAPRPEEAPRERSPEPGAPTRPGSPAGSPEGTTTAAVAGFDRPDFTYGYYIDQMLAQIRAGWARPPVGPDVETVIYFRIQRDGSITDLRVATPSGFQSFDLAGLRAVQSASPLPPLPRGYRHDSLGVNLILR